MRRTTAVLASALTAVGLAPLVAVPASATARVPAFVFTSERDGDPEIYRRLADGRTVQLTRNRSSDYGAVFSPDGRRLAFVSNRDGDDEIYVMNADGTGVRQLTRNGTGPDGVPVNDGAPAWAPDGNRIAFVSNRDGGEGEIYRMNDDGSGQVRLTRTPAYVSDSTPSWAPNGHEIVFSSDRLGVFNVEIFRMWEDGSQVTRLTRTPDGVDDNAPEYSPDGTRIVFSRLGDGRPHDLWSMRADGSDARRMGGDPARDDVFPKWTANGRQVVFQTFADPDGSPADTVWIMDRDGTDRRRLTDGKTNSYLPDPEPAPPRY